MKPMRTSVLLLLSLFLTLSCKNETFDWEADPWVGSVQDQELINAQGESISCAEPKFEEMVCFSLENLAELKAAIQKVESPKHRKTMIRKYHSFFKQINFQR